MMSSVKYKPLGEHRDPSLIRQPFLMFLTAMGFMVFFVLYMTSSGVAPFTLEYEQFSTGFTTNATTTEAGTTEAENSTDLIGGNPSGNHDDHIAEEVVTLSTEPIPEVTDEEIYDKYAIYTSKCRIRNYDYKDAAILKKYFSYNPKYCPRDAKPFIFYAKLNLKTGSSCIALNNSIFKTHYGSDDFKSWNCTYKEAIRSPRYQVIDKHHDFGPKKNLTINDCPKEEFLWIECAHPSSVKAYQQPLILPVVKNVPKPVRGNNIGKKPLHVLVVGLDSVSRLNAHRQFPKTMKFLNSKKNLIELFGYNKIGVNSAPNQIPLLTGVPYAMPGMKARVGKNYFDNLTRFIWDDYEDRGYRTMFYEEQWIYGLFVYPSLNGFKKVPTTYWPRPMMQAIDKSTLKAAGNGWCIGPDFPTKHYLDYTYNTMKILGTERPLFSYSWLSETAHDQVYGGKRVDGYFEDFFQKMENDGILNHTAVFFISDHGFRFGAFRKSDLGRYEDMLPYGFVLMPEWYYNEIPDALENIRANSRKLVTVYDLHATLLELADMWSEGRVTQTGNGYSLFSNVIPDYRTCTDADIDFQFCSCFENQPQNRESQLAKSLADFVIKNLNENIKSATKKCEKWSLRSIENFVQLSEGKSWTNFFKISIRTYPEAQFEAAADFSSNEWKMMSDIDRTDWYSSHSKCAKNTDYEKYCYCKSTEKS